MNMTVKNGIIYVLKRALKALHYREITRQILDDRLCLGLQSKKPENVVNRVITTDMNEKLENSVFIRTGPGIYDLREGGTKSSSQNLTGEKSHKRKSSMVVAKIILKQEGKPLTAKDLSKAIQDSGLCPGLKGKTPWDTVRAQIQRDIKKKNEDSNFEIFERGLIGLRGMQYVIDNEEELDENFSNGDVKKQIETNDILDAVTKVLEEFGNQNPMHFKEIAKKTIERGWLKKKDKFLDSKIKEEVTSEIISSFTTNNLGKFFSTGFGFFGLLKWGELDLLTDIDSHNANIERELHDRIMKLDPHDFEELIGELLIKMGYKNVVVTQRSRDGGIDVRAFLEADKLTQQKVAIQVKRTTNVIPISVVREVRGGLEIDEKGVIITTSDFTKDAIDNAKGIRQQSIELMNGNDLIKCLIENKIGVRTEKVDYRKHSDFPLGKK